MKQCPLCGSKFSGAETFCPHDGARLIDAQQPAQLVGQELHHLIKLERLLYKDAFGERYAAHMLGNAHKVKVTVFNQAFTPPLERVEALVSTKALLDTPLPPQIASAHAWDLESEPSYLVETLPAGPSLRLLLQERGKLDWRTALKIICSLSKNLEWMDNQGVTHRALSPDTIHVTDINKGYTHLSEWALGTLAYQENPLQAVARGALITAPAYMAPELIDGGARADRRATLYSLGLILYEMLTGKAPFRSANTEETLKRQRRERPVKLSISYEGDPLPPSLDDLFEVITDKLPERRFQSLGALLNAMSSLLDDGTSAIDFPEPVRAEEEPTILLKKNGTTPHPVEPSPSQDEEEDEQEEESGRKKTLLFISAEELKKAQEAQALQKQAEAEAASPSAPPAATPEPEPTPAAAQPEAATPAPTPEVDDATNKPTLQMDSSVLEADIARHKEGAPAPEEVVTEPPTRKKKKKKKTEVFSRDASLPEHSNQVSIDDPEEDAEASEVSEAVDEGRKSTIVISKDFAQELEQNQDAESHAPPQQDEPISDTSPAAAPPLASDSPSKTLSGSSQTQTEDKPAIAVERVEPTPQKSVEISQELPIEPAASVEIETPVEVETPGEVEAPEAEEKQDTSQPRNKSKSKSKNKSKSKDKDKDKDTASRKAVVIDESALSLPDVDPTPSQSVAPLTTGKDLDDLWFQSGTEDAWDREIHLEHAARTDKKFKTYLVTALVLFIVALLTIAVILYLQPEDDGEEDASLLRSEPVTHQLV